MRAIPPSVTSEIVRKYLEGYSIPEISKMFNVSVGKVSSIVKEEATKDLYFLVLREVARLLKNNNLEISDVISGIRLKNQIKEVGLTISFFEDFLESTNTASFKLGMDHEKFLEEIKRIMRLEEQLNIKLGDVPQYIKNKNEEIKMVRTKIAQVIQKQLRLYFEYFAKREEVEEYIKEKSTYLQYKIEKETLPTYFDWIIPNEIFEKEFRKKGIKIDKKNLYDKLNSIFRDPANHIEIIDNILSYFENQKKKV